MSAEKFTIEQQVIYTIKSAHGVIECKGLKALESHVENTLGAFIDRLHDNHTGLRHKDMLADYDFLLKHRADLETIYSMIDAVEAIKTPPAPDHACDDYYCNRCGSSSAIEFCGNE